MDAAILSRAPPLTHEVQCPAPQFLPLSCLLGSLPEPKVIGVRCPPLEHFPVHGDGLIPAPAAEKQLGKLLAQCIGPGTQRLSREPAAHPLLRVTVPAGLPQHRDD